MVPVDIDIDLPNLAAQWAMGNLSTLLRRARHACGPVRADLTDEIALGLILSQALYNLNLAAVAEAQRIEANEVMAAAFEQVDYIIAATNPGPAFAAECDDLEPAATFLDTAKACPAAQLAFRGRHGCACAWSTGRSRSWRTRWSTWWSTRCPTWSPWAV